MQADVVPASLKRASVLTRLKKPTLDPTTVSSYRPISNLSFISKLLERVASARFVSHAEENTLFLVHQSYCQFVIAVIQPKTTIPCVHNDIVSKRIVGLVLLDLSSAFDTVNHNTLRTVFRQRFGVCESALSWFESYLSDRTQNFHVNGASPGAVAVNCSVPQGSVLWPILFISYTDKLSIVFHRHKVRHHLYADDKQAYKDAAVQDVSLARLALQNCISDVANWCLSRLQLNASKTEVIWFGSRHSLKQVNDKDLTLQLDSSTIHPVSIVLDLDVMTDSEISVKQHGTKVAGSCFYHLRRLKQIRRLVGKDVTAKLVSAITLSRQSCRAFNCLSTDINILAGGRPLPPEILPASDLPSPVNGILWEMSELVTQERIAVESSNFVEGLTT